MCHCEWQTATALNPGFNGMCMLSPVVIAMSDRLVEIVHRNHACIVVSRHLEKLVQLLQYEA